MLLSSVWLCFCLLFDCVFVFCLSVLLFFIVFCIVVLWLSVLLSSVWLCCCLLIDFIIVFRLSVLLSSDYLYCCLKIGCIVVFRFSVLSLQIVCIDVFRLSVLLSSDFLYRCLLIDCVVVFCLTLLLSSDCLGLIITIQYRYVKHSSQASFLNIFYDFYHFFVERFWWLSLFDLNMAPLLFHSL